MPRKHKLRREPVADRTPTIVASKRSRAIFGISTPEEFAACAATAARLTQAGKVNGERVLRLVIASLVVESERVVHGS